VDKCAYAQLLPYPEHVIEAMHTYYFNAFPGFSENDTYIYFPPVLQLVDDGVRDTDKKYQEAVDYMIQFYLDAFGIPFLTLTERDVQDRYLQICSFLNAIKREF
jgi:hypothetical protein